jgi:hypothetical protein
MKRRRPIAYVDDLITTGTKLSSLSRVVACEGEELEILIAEVAPRRWSLEVINAQGIRSVWTKLFKAEENALREALRTIASAGPANFAMDLSYRQDPLH